MQRLTSCDPKRTCGSKISATTSCGLVSGTVAFQSLGIPTVLVALRTAKLSNVLLSMIGSIFYFSSLPLCHFLFLPGSGTSFHRQHSGGSLGPSFLGQSAQQRCREQRSESSSSAQRAPFREHRPQRSTQQRTQARSKDIMRHSVMRCAPETSSEEQRASKNGESRDWYG